MGKRVAKISEEAMGLLVRHSWPGNVRELENVIERAVALETTAAVLPERLPDALRAPARGPERSEHGPGTAASASTRTSPRSSASCSIGRSQEADGDRLRPAPSCWGSAREPCATSCRSTASQGA